MLGGLVLHRKCGAFHFSDEQYCRFVKEVEGFTVSDVMESGQVVENPMIGAIPSRNEVQRELDDLLMSM